MTDPSKRIFTAPNVLSFGRLLLLIPLFVFLRQGDRGNGNLWAIVVMGAALLTDWLDGLIARRFDQESDWGKVLDPLADKVWIGCLALFLALPWRAHPLPLLFFIMMLVRDFGIVWAAIYAYRRMGVITVSNWLGKIAMVAEALTLLAYTIYWEQPVIAGIQPEFFVWVTAILILLSGISYTQRLRAMVAEARKNNPASRSASPLNASS